MGACTQQGASQTNSRTVEVGELFGFSIPGHNQTELNTTEEENRDEDHMPMPCQCNED